MYVMIPLRFSPALYSDRIRNFIYATTLFCLLLEASILDFLRNRNFLKAKSYRTKLQFSPT